jgi:hypothetical protein
MGLDPSGAYDEGKGTTGWSLYDCMKHKFVDVDELEAVRHSSAIEYWQAHKLLIAGVCGHKDISLAIEDFLLYAHKAESQINSHFETCQLLGIVKVFCSETGYVYRMQQASEVKRRWDDDILVYKGFIEQRGKSFYLPDTNKRLTDHMRDSMRHAIHYAMFYNKGGSTNERNHRGRMPAENTGTM